MSSPSSQSECLFGSQRFGSIGGRTPTNAARRCPAPATWAELAPGFWCGLNQLARALDYAQDLGGPLWDFAVELDRLLALGMTTSDLRGWSNAVT